MAYTLNGIDLYNTYGITASHALGSNVAMAGVFDMPQRTGKTYHDWGDSDSVEPWVREDEIMFAGRDIQFSGFLTGTTSAINTKLQTFYDAINAATGLSIFETPYHSASGYIKTVIPEHMNGGCTVKMTFREPAVALTGTLPASGTSVAYMIDNIPFSSFGLYLSKADQLHNLPENKEQYFTKYGQEGYQIVKRKHKILEINGFVAGSSLSDFTSKIEALYKVFSSSGTRTIVLNSIVTVVCFATEGFKIENVHYSNNGVIGRFHINLMVKSVAYYDAGYDADLNTYISGLSIALSDAQLTKINTFLVNYKTADSLTNLSDAYDVMYYLGNETAESSLRNLVKRAHDAVVVNSPTFTAYEGFAGDGISSYIDTNYQIDTDKVNYAVNNASFGIYYRSNIAAANIGSGCRNGTTSYISMRVRDAGASSMSAILNQGGSFGAAPVNNSGTPGMFISSKTSAGSSITYKNKIAFAARTASVDAIPDYNIYLGARNDSGASAEIYSNRQMAFAFCGKGLSQANINNLTDNFEVLMDANGKGVIA